MFKMEVGWGGGGVGGGIKTALPKIFLPLRNNKWLNSWMSSSCFQASLGFRPVAAVSGNFSVAETKASCMYSKPNVFLTVVCIALEVPFFPLSYKASIPLPKYCWIVVLIIHLCTLTWPSLVETTLRGLEDYAYFPTPNWCGLCIHPVPLPVGGKPLM